MGSTKGSLLPSNLYWKARAASRQAASTRTTERRSLGRLTVIVEWKLVRVARVSTGCSAGAGSARANCASVVSSSYLNVTCGLPPGVSLMWSSPVAGK